MSQKKYRGTEIEFSPVYFNSTTKTVINRKFDLDKSFQETGLMKVLVRLLNQINLSASIFQLLDNYQEVLTWNCLLNWEVQKKNWSTLKTIKNVFFGVILGILIK